MRCSTVWSCLLSWSLYTLFYLPALGVLNTCLFESSLLPFFFFRFSDSVPAIRNLWSPSASVMSETKGHVKHNKVRYSRGTSAKTHQKALSSPSPGPKKPQNVVSEQKTYWMPLGHHVQSLSLFNAPRDSTTNTSTVCSMLSGNLRETIPPCDILNVVILLALNDIMTK